MTIPTSSIDQLIPASAMAQPAAARPAKANRGRSRVG